MLTQRRIFTARLINTFMFNVIQVWVLRTQIAPNLAFKIEGKPPKIRGTPPESWPQIDAGLKKMEGGLYGKSESFLAEVEGRNALHNVERG